MLSAADVDRIVDANLAPIRERNPALATRIERLLGAAPPALERDRGT